MTYQFTDTLIYNPDQISKDEMFLKTNIFEARDIDACIP